MWVEVQERERQKKQAKICISCCVYFVVDGGKSDGPDLVPRFYRSRKMRRGAGNEVDEARKPQHAGTER